MMLFDIKEFQPLRTIPPHSSSTDITEQWISVIKIKFSSLIWARSFVCKPSAPILYCGKSSWLVDSRDQVYCNHYVSFFTVVEMLILSNNMTGCNLAVELSPTERYRTTPVENGVSFLSTLGLPKLITIVRKL